MAVSLRFAVIFMFYFLSSCTFAIQPPLASSDAILNVLLVAIPQAGHMHSMLAVGEELTARGHNVTMYSMKNWFNAKRKSLERGFNYLSAGNFITDNETEFRKVLKSQIGKQSSFVPWVKLQGISEAFLMIKNFSDVLTKHVIENNDLSQWDIIVADFFHYSLCCHATSVGVPCVVIADAAPTNYNPWSHPILFTGSSTQLNFFGRARSVIFYILEVLTGFDHVYALAKTGSNRANAVCREILPSYPLQRHPLIVRSVMGLDYPQVLLPLTSHVGPLLSKYNKPLQDGDLIQWLANKEERSVVYISMGSIVSINENTAKAFIDGISQTKYSVLWALNKANQYVLSNIKIDNKHIFISHWIPQVAVLQHASISMAILHGGANGVNEALKFGVPLIVIPQMGDQYDWAIKIERAGVGLQIPHVSMITASLIKDYIDKIDTGSYREKAQRMKLIIKAAGGVDKASDLVEFYGTVGYNHLLPAPIEYNWNWIQYYNIDVKTVLVFILVITVALAFKMCQCCCRFCFCRKKEKLE